MTEREVVAGLMNANNTLFNVLIRSLDAAGILNREAMRQALLGFVAAPKASPEQGAVLRYDVAQFENLAALLVDQEIEPRWRPVVVQGGKSAPTT